MGTTLLYQEEEIHMNFLTMLVIDLYIT